MHVPHALPPIDELACFMGTHDLPNSSVMSSDGRRIGLLRWEDAVRLALEEPIHDETAEEETQ